jgi:hypothetical protein
MASSALTMNGQRAAGFSPSFAFGRERGAVSSYAAIRPGCSTGSRARMSFSMPRRNGRSL